MEKNMKLLFAACLLIGIIYSISQSISQLPTKTASARADIVRDSLTIHFNSMQAIHDTVQQMNASPVKLSAAEFRVYYRAFQDHKKSYDRLLKELDSFYAGKLKTIKP